MAVKYIWVERTCPAILYANFNAAKRHLQVHANKCARLVGERPTKLVWTREDNRLWAYDRLYVGRANGYYAAIERRLLRT